MDIQVELLLQAIQFITVENLLLHPVAEQQFHGSWITIGGKLA